VPQPTTLLHAPLVQGGKINCASNAACAGSSKPGVLKIFLNNATLIGGFSMADNPNINRNILRILNGMRATFRLQIPHGFQN
jgi:hypothetical protein